MQAFQLQGLEQQQILNWFGGDKLSFMIYFRPCSSEYYAAWQRLNRMEVEDLFDD